MCRSCIVSTNLAGVPIAETLTAAWIETGLQVIGKGRLMSHNGELPQGPQLDLIVTYSLRFMYGAGMHDFCRCTSITQEFGALEPWRTPLHRLIMQKLQPHTVFAIKVPAVCNLVTPPLCSVAWKWRGRPTLGDAPFETCHNTTQVHVVQTMICSHSSCDCKKISYSSNMGR